MGSSDEMLVFKINPCGTLVWTNFLNGTSNLSDFARGIALDLNTNVIVIGRLEKGGGVGDFVTWTITCDGVTV